MRRILQLLPLLTACATGRAAAPPVPLVDSHQHLVSPAFAPLVKLPVRDGKALLAELDAAGIRRAVVLSVRYSFFGGEDARLFLDKLVAAAPSIEIVVAHLGGAGPGYPPQADELMAVFGAAAERGDTRMRDVYFDVATAGNVTGFAR